MTPNSPTGNRSRGGAGSPNLVLLIVCTGVVLASLDLFMVNIALPEIARDLGESDVGNLSWVLNAYSITFASLLVLFGRLAERHPRQIAFLLGVGVFVSASLMCALAPTTEALIAFRVLQGAGAALLTPTSLSLVLATAPAEKRPAAVALWASAGGIAAAIGPIVGGLLAAGSWRWVFLVNLPVGIAALVVGIRRLPHVPGHQAPRPDISGAVLVTSFVALLVLGLTQGSSWGWSSTLTIAVIAGSGVLGLLFARRCLASDNPLVDPDLFRRRMFRGASVVAVLFSAAFAAMLLSISFWQQQVWDWSALRAGFALAPGPAMVPLFSMLVTDRVVARRGAATAVAIGSLAFAVGIAWWAVAIDVEANYVVGMLPGMLLTGIGVGLALPAFMMAATGALGPSDLTTGSGVITMIRQVGMALGVAMFVGLVGSPSSPAEALDAFRTAWTATAVLSLLSGAAAVVMLSMPRTLTPVSVPRLD